MNKKQLQMEQHEPPKKGKFRRAGRISSSIPLITRKESNSKLIHRTQIIPYCKANIKFLESKKTPKLKTTPSTNNLSLMASFRGNNFDRYTFENQNIRS